MEKYLEEEGEASKKMNTLFREMQVLETVGEDRLIDAVTNAVDIKHMTYSASGSYDSFSAMEVYLKGKFPGEYTLSGGETADLLKHLDLLKMFKPTGSSESAIL